MSNVINFPSTRRLTRASGKVFEIDKRPLYEVWLRFRLPKKNRDLTEDLLYGHIFRLLQKLRGFDQTRGFTLDVLQGSEWHELPHCVRPRLLKRFLQAVDIYCESGWLEVEVDGVLMARSKHA